MFVKRSPLCSFPAGEALAMNHDGVSADIFARARAGDAAALGTLLEFYRPGLLRFLTRRGLTLPDAEDVIQDAYALVPLKLADFDWRDAACFRAWLKQLVRGKFADWRKHRRRAKRDGRRLVELPSESGVPAASAEETPSRAARHRERDAALRAAMQAVLSAREHRAIRLRFFKKRSVAETAAEMGCSEQVVKNLCTRSLKKLKQFLGEPAQYLSSRWGWRQPKPRGDTPDATPGSLPDCGRDQGHDEGPADSPDAAAS
jgi:RNA polymerase sigma factor (sigma-70 family)